jgi:hypothetical protein
MFNKVIARGNPRSGIINHLYLRLTLNYLETGSKSVHPGQRRPRTTCGVFAFQERTELCSGKRMNAKTDERSESGPLGNVGQGGSPEPRRRSGGGNPGWATTLDKSKTSLVCPVSFWLKPTSSAYISSVWPAPGGSRCPTPETTGPGTSRHPCPARAGNSRPKSLAFGPLRCTNGSTACRPPASSILMAPCSIRFFIEQLGNIPILPGYKASSCPTR